jgi:fimbrial chaperone protein
MRIGPIAPIGATGGIVLAGLVGLFGLLAVAVPGPARAGSFAVVPVKLDLDARTTTAVLKVTNQGPAQVTLQASAKTWTQNADGDPVYEDTPDVVVFPKLLTIEPGEERILRVGYRGPKTGDTERAYRVFLEELPLSAGPEAGLAMTLRLGVPLFVAPHRPRALPALGALELTDGTLGVTVENRGNVRVVVGRILAAGVEADGTKRVLAEQRGWYVLAGDHRTFRLPLPEEPCRASRAIELSADAEGTELAGRLDVDAARCAPPTP